MPAVNYTEQATVLGAYLITLATEIMNLTLQMALAHPMVVVLLCIIFFGGTCGEGGSGE